MGIRSQFHAVVVAFVLLGSGCGASVIAGSADVNPGPDADSGEDDFTVSAPPAEVGDVFMAVDGPMPVPGEEFGVYFDESNVRGGAFTLQKWSVGLWNEPTYLLISDANGDKPTATRITDSNFGWDDWGNGGTGPDGLLLPPDLASGYWRLCTANARDEGCVQLVVQDSDDVPTVSSDSEPGFGPLAATEMILIEEPYRATAASLDRAALPIRTDDEIVITFDSRDRLSVSYDRCSWGTALYRFDGGRLVTSEWESDAEGCDQSTPEIRRLLLDLFESEPVVRIAANGGLQLTTERAVLRLEASGGTLPALVDPCDFAAANNIVPLNQLEGLSEDQARRWATDSGFAVVVRSDEDHTGDLRPHERLIITVDQAGIVTRAIAG